MQKQTYCFSMKSKYNTGRWDQEETQKLCKVINEQGAHNWAKISDAVGTRSMIQCYDRWMRRINPEINKTQFTEQEDSLITDLVINQQITSWSEIAKRLKKRDSAQVRKRWKYLQQQRTPDRTWNQQEDLLLIKLYKQYGDKWRKFLKYFDGRTENCLVKRYDELWKIDESSIDSSQSLTHSDNKNIEEGSKIENIEIKDNDTEENDHSKLCQSSIDTSDFNICLFPFLDPKLDICKSRWKSASENIEIERIEKEAMKGTFASILKIQNQTTNFVDTLLNQDLEKVLWLLQGKEINIDEIDYDRSTTNSELNDELSSGNDKSTDKFSYLIHKLPKFEESKIINKTVDMIEELKEWPLVQSTLERIGQQEQEGLLEEFNKLIDGFGQSTAKNNKTLEILQSIDV